MDVKKKKRFEIPKNFSIKKLKKDQLLILLLVLLAVIQAPQRMLHAEYLKQGRGKHDDQHHPGKEPDILFIIRIRKDMDDRCNQHHIKRNILHPFI